LTNLITVSSPSYTKLQQDIRPKIFRKVLQSASRDLDEETASAVMDCLKTLLVSGLDLAETIGKDHISTFVESLCGSVESNCVSPNHYLSFLAACITCSEAILNETWPVVKEKLLDLKKMDHLKPAIGQMILEASTRTSCEVTLIVD
jgi:hypothetical protein